MALHLQKAPVTLDQSLAVAFTLANLNRGVKELAAQPYGSLLEIGLVTFLGLCTGAWLPEMFSEVPRATAVVGITGSLSDDTQSNAAYRVFISRLLGYGFKLTQNQANALTEHLIADELPSRKHDGTVLTEGEKGTVLLSDLMPAAGGDPIIDGRSKTLKLGDTTSTSIEMLRTS